jgi:hypothetical protein
MFFGPGYPIAHPGIFPFNQRALKWSIQDWLKFNYRAAWGMVAWEEVEFCEELTNFVRYEKKTSD